ncbi:MAG TPA: methyltransferase domain-containing protein [Terracidiphilus sp.]|nr:methyltransferase domain-containing protein [Terracidiphilus sp.]
MNTALAMKPMRGPWQGMAQILRFNWRMYLAAVLGTAAALGVWPLLPVAGRVFVAIAVAPALFWMVASLAVSHYVYDMFPLYDLRWMARALAVAPRRWINIHAGWDETSELLQAVFPNAVGEAVDLFDPRVMTEASIRQARGASRAAILTTPARFDALPFENGTVDAAFVIFAAHELRRRNQRVKFFAEIARVLTSGGECLILEHARGWWNFLAFGPGFLHFFSQRECRQVAQQAGLDVKREFAMTWFVHVFMLGRTR